jgi:uncharacterized protein (DUF58 family)
VREVLRGLTLRGRSFLSAGISCVLAAFLIGQLDVLRLGLFIVALPIAAAVWVTRSRYRLAHTREVVPPRIPLGQIAEVRLRVRNLSAWPTSVLLLEDRLSYTLGGRPRFVLDRLEPDGDREVSYPIRSDVRGRYSLGPLSVRVGDPFGLCELNRAFTSVDELIVTPVVHRLPDIGLGGEWAGGGDTRARSFAASGEDDASTREFRQGDDLRKVHWKSTARTGELMVRREEQPWQSRSTLILDTRAVAHRGDGPGSSFEWAVSAAASVGVHLAQAGYALRYLTDTGEDIAMVSPAATEGALLDTLAVVQPSGHKTLRGATGRLSGTGEGLLVAIVGLLAPDEAALLARGSRATTGAIAILVDAATWSGSPERSHDKDSEGVAANMRMLRGAGWRVVVASHGMSLASMWPQVAKRPGLSARPSGGAFVRGAR